MVTPKTTKKTPTKIDIESIRHQDTRTNIPTEELRDFVAADEGAPATMLYPRDPSLDPQLVWRGKDEQDRVDLAVPVVPIYIQEKIHPQAVIDDLRRHSPSPSADGEGLGRGHAQQLDLFATFDGPEADFDQKIEFYQHQQQWSNRMILGDSLMVMTSLAEKEGLKGKVQTIYLDPPYGIRFGSNWQVSTRKRDVKDGSATDATRQPEQVKAFRDTWQLGIHSYLAYLRDRLVAARELLTDSGSVFVQIGDENVHVVRSVLDEIFGADNFISMITVSKTGSLTGELISNVADYLLLYAKDKSSVKFRKLFENRRGESEEAFTADPLKSDGFRTGTTFDYHFDDRTFPCKSNEHWKVTRAGLDRLAEAERLIPLRTSLRFKKYWADFPAIESSNLWLGFGGATDLTYVVQTNRRIVERCLLMTTDPGDLVLDPTCGSGTTAYVAEQWGRRWITVDTSRVALALARTRLMAARYPFYLLADSAEGIRQETKLTGRTPPQYRTEDDIRKGFVYRRVPHVTLKSIANNPDIHEGMTREQIDAAVARHADSETLYDQPYEDKARVRVSGPFTVESLSPHRVLSTADEDMDGVVSLSEQSEQADFATMIIDNLRRAGVQNGTKGERLTFDRLDPHAGTWVNATGEYTDADGQSHSVAVSLGPEHGTVGAYQIKEAAKEAVKGVGFDVLVVCGFAFDAAVTEERKNYGRLQVLPTKMNPDLAMGDELLKKTGAGNLFMVFGEPDVEITKDAGQITVKINGVDVYDPTTGAVRSGSTDDIACWFIDTDYNQESFFVRHAYFTGADQPYDKLKRALRAEIDEDAWASLYRTESRPFARPEGGRIAIKVINHYGDEVMKVYEV